MEPLPLVPSARAREREPEPEQEEQLMPNADSSGAAAPSAPRSGCPHAASRAQRQPTEALSTVFDGAGKLGLGFNHSDSGPAIVVSVVAGSLASSKGVVPGMVLCRVASEEVGSLPCICALEVLRKMSPVRPLELGFARPDNDDWPDEGELSSAQQLRVAWRAILAREVAADQPMQWPQWKQIHAGVVQTDTSAMISCPMDEPQDPDQPQLICPNGAVCRATISWVSTGYSGLFSAAGGPVEGLLRLSSALEPVNMSGWNPMALAIGSVAKSKLFPCAAFKAYRGSSINSGTHPGQRFLC